MRVFILPTPALNLSHPNPITTNTHEIRALLAEPHLSHAVLLRAINFEGYLLYSDLLRETAPGEELPKYRWGEEI